MSENSSDSVQFESVVCLEIKEGSKSDVTMGMGERGGGLKQDGSIAGYKQNPDFIWCVVQYVYIILVIQDFVHKYLFSEIQAIRRGLGRSGWMYYV